MSSMRIYDRGKFVLEMMTENSFDVMFFVVSIFYKNDYIDTLYKQLFIIEIFHFSV